MLGAAGAATGSNSSKQEQQQEQYLWFRVYRGLEQEQKQYLE
jgi:hypothetical protein